MIEKDYNSKEVEKMDSENQVTFQCKIYIKKEIISTKMKISKHLSMRSFVLSLKKMIQTLPQYDDTLSVVEIDENEENHIAIFSLADEIYFFDAYKNLENVSELYKKSKELSILCLSNSSIFSILNQESQMIEKALQKLKE